MTRFTRTVLPHLLMGTVMVLTVLTAQAEASPPICPIYPPEQWMPMGRVEDMARQMNLGKFYVQPEGGCWGIYYHDAEGTNWELLLNPKTGEQVKLRRT